MLEETSKDWWGHRQAWDIDPTWAWTWLFNWVSATCWGGFTWLVNLLQKMRGVIDIIVRSPQMETLMILLFISASLWGCLTCESSTVGRSTTKILEVSMCLNVWFLHQHYPNTCTGLKTEYSKCYLLGYCCWALEQNMISCLPREPNCLCKHIFLFSESV